MVLHFKSAVFSFFILLNVENFINKLYNKVGQKMQKKILSSIYDSLKSHFADFNSAICFVLN